MNEDHYLTATIYNNNYSNTIELLRTKASHYDAVFSKSYIQKAGFCQNIVLNLIDKAVNGNKSNQFKNLNGDEFVNILWESSLVQANTPKESNNLEQFRVTRGHHKKSLSDNFNTNFEFMEEQQMKFYDAFMNAGPTGDLLQNFRVRKDTAESGGFFRGGRKDTAESGFSINANFDFINDEDLNPPFKAQEFAIKNYPISSGGLSPRGPAALELDSPMPAFNKAKFSNHPNILFNENLSLAEIERLEKTTATDPKQLGASPFYRNASPPGLSPTKFSQRTFTDTVQTTPSDFLSPSPTMPRETNLQAMSPSYPYGSNSPSKRSIQPFGQPYQGMNNEQQMFNPQAVNNQRSFPGSNNIQAFAPQAQVLNSQSQTFQLQPQQYNSLYMKRTPTVGASTSMPGQQQSDGFNMGQQNMGYEQGMEYDQGFDPSAFEGGMDFDSMYGGFDGAQREKKKPIILDESKERYCGRLKFFDENKKYGFIIMDDDGSDIFVHYDDLCKANITKDLLRTARMGNVIRVTFGCMAYIGKYNRSRKAIDIQLVM